MDKSNALIALSSKHHDHPEFLSVFRFLLDREADVNALDKQGRSPLIIVCSEMNMSEHLIKVVRLLIKNGVVQDERKKAVKILVKRGIPSNSEIFQLLRRA